MGDTLNYNNVITNCMGFISLRGERGSILVLPTRRSEIIITGSRACSHSKLHGDWHKDVPFTLEISAVIHTNGSMLIRVCRESFSTIL